MTLQKQSQTQTQTENMKNIKLNKVPKIQTTVHIQQKGIAKPIPKRRVQKAYHRWSEIQNLKYIIFLNNNQDKMVSQYTRRKQKVFKKLAEAIQSRDDNQCKSHHQKMVKFHTNVQGIIYDFVQKYQKKLSKQVKIQQLQTVQIKMQVKKQEYFIFPQYYVNYDPFNNLTDTMAMVKLEPDETENKLNIQN